MNSSVAITSIIEAADDYDLVTLQDVKDDLGITVTTDDAYLERRITELSAVAQHYMNRTLQMETVRDQFWPQRDPYPWQLPGGVMPLQLSRWPIAGAVAGSALAPPPAPDLSQTAGGASDAPQTFFVVTTYVTVEGETLPSPEASISVDAGALLTVGPPPTAVDSALRPAIGWNVYVGLTQGAEARQNGQAPLPMDAPFTLPAAPVTGLSPPPATSVFENSRALIEGTDYLVDAVRGHLTRQGAIEPYPVRWLTLPIVVQYAAGFDPIPPDVSGTLSRAVKALYMSRMRDPAIKSQSAAGIYAASYSSAKDPGAGALLPPDAYAVLDGYRVPVIA
jgi:hypothetical protein